LCCTCADGKLQAPDPSFSFRIVNENENNQIEEGESDSEDEDFDQEEYFFELAKKQYEQVLQENPQDLKIQGRYAELLAKHSGSPPTKKRRQETKDFT